MEGEGCLPHMLPLIADTLHMSPERNIWLPGLAEVASVPWGNTVCVDSLLGKEPCPIR